MSKPQEGDTVVAGYNSFPLLRQIDVIHRLVPLPLVSVGKACFSELVTNSLIIKASGITVSMFRVMFSTEITGLIMYSLTP